MAAGWLAGKVQQAGCKCVDKQCSKQSLYASFSYPFPFQHIFLHVFEPNIFHYHTLSTQRSHIRKHGGKGEERMLDCWFVQPKQPSLGSYCRPYAAVRWWERKKTGKRDGAGKGWGGGFSRTKPSRDLRRGAKRRRKRRKKQQQQQQGWSHG